MFEISKYKKSNVKLSIRLPQNMDELIRKIAKKENMSYNNVLVSSLEYAFSNIDKSKYEDVDIEY